MVLLEDVLQCKEIRIKCSGYTPKLRQSDIRYSSAHACESRARSITICSEQSKTLAYTVIDQHHTTAYRNKESFKKDKVNTDVQFNNEIFKLVYSDSWYVLLYFGATIKSHKTKIKLLSFTLEFIV